MLVVRLSIFSRTCSVVLGQHGQKFLASFVIGCSSDLGSIDHRIFGLWKEHMENRYSCVMRGARDKAIFDAIVDGIEVENDLSVIIPYNPPWIKQEYWIELVQKHWNTEDWKAKSEIAKANHSQMIGGHHTCGSVSYDTTRKRFEKTKGRPLVDCELFTHSHLKKGTRPGEGLPPVYVDERSRLQVEAYQRRMIEKYGEDIDEYSYDESIWEECAGGRKKGRLYGSDKHAGPTFLFTGKSG